MKPWYKSKTILVNAAVAGLVALEASTGVLKGVVADNFYTVIAVALPVINAMLRIITTQPIGREK